MIGMILVLPLMVLCIAPSPSVDDLSCHYAAHLAISPNTITVYITESPYVLQLKPTTCSFDSPTGEILCHNYKTQPSYATP